MLPSRKAETHPAFLQHPTYLSVFYCGAGELFGYLAHSVDIGVPGGLVDVLELDVGYGEVVTYFFDGFGNLWGQAVVDEVDDLGIGVAVAEM